MTAWKFQMKKTRMEKPTKNDDDDMIRTRVLDLTQEEESDLGGLLLLSNGFIGLPFCAPPHED